MNNFNYLCVCELEDCQLFLENPIILPCGSAICEEHLENCEEKYFCTICDKEHPVPEDGFPINKFAQKTIQSGVHLNEIQKK